MKCNEFIREIKKKDWTFLRQGKGSHEIYEKDGKSISILNHGSREIPTGLEKNLRKEMRL